METATLTRPPKTAARPASTLDPQPPVGPPVLFSDDDAAPPRMSAVVAEPAPAPIPTITAEPPVRDPKAEWMWILDTTAVAEMREHVMMVNGTISKYEFHARRPTLLHPAVAVKFLAEPAFRLTDADGVIQEWSAVPKQPHQLQAGERFHLDANQTVARYDELTGNAIKIRALQLPGGEAYSASRDKDAMVAFIIEQTDILRRKNIGREAMTGGVSDLEEFTPAPENDSVFFGDEF